MSTDTLRRDDLIRRAGELRRRLGGDLRHTLGVNTLAPPDDELDTPDARELRAIERAIAALGPHALAD